ncbi:hypothetical protein O6H91_08G117900 [Diphasiastrum complanatum]|uniref:Uncharacterized protein n=1 Tax=Diphasiastrum complanatum TaxID=34168 RepID=A0ACC2D1F6_DIPCM|nr:hypothetical protein O6H91_Y353800 [Diphasiastrum complanatum]KAJ7295256.1 hypothetical protein O6H91_Y203400 [Diphasiastrum complanatum]KAJ7548111.1 hypothetical protein O6H91_08G117900 [Diphasiastrum complanatum]
MLVGLVPTQTRPVDNHRGPGEIPASGISWRNHTNANRNHNSQHDSVFCTLTVCVSTVIVTLSSLIVVHILCAMLEADVPIRTLKSCLYVLSWCLYILFLMYLTKSNIHRISVVCLIYLFANLSIIARFTILSRV